MQGDAVVGLLRSRGQDLTQSLSLRASRAAPEGRVQTQVMQTKPWAPPLLDLPLSPRKWDACQVRLQRDIRPHETSS